MLTFSGIDANRSEPLLFTQLECFSSFAINIRFHILVIHPSSLSLCNVSPHWSLRPLASCHPSFFQPSFTPISFYLPSPFLCPVCSLSSFQSSPSPVCLFPRPFPLQPYHLTLMMVFNHLYGRREGLHPAARDTVLTEKGQREPTKYSCS